MSRLLSEIHPEAVPPDANAAEIFVGGLFLVLMPALVSWVVMHFLLAILLDAFLVQKRVRAYEHADPVRTADQDCGCRI